jgi:sensor histidine kinase YesM
MRKRLGLLLAGFIILYYLTHAVSSMPYLLHHAHFDWLPYNTTASFLRHIMALGIGFIFAAYSYLMLFYFYPAGKIKTVIMLGIVGFVVMFFITERLAFVIITSPIPIRRRLNFSPDLFFFFVYAVYGVIFYFIRYSHYKELEQKELLLQNQQSELAFLRSQINPHFLFNSLNNIYALVYAKSDQALTAIAGLSELMRYMLYNSAEKIPLQKEWEYIQQYVELQTLRFAHPIMVNLHVDGPVSEILIQPLLLVPFVENAFKHGDFSVDSPGLTVSLNSSKSKTVFYCSNKKGKGMKDAGGGIGIVNVKRRLDLLYPLKHVLEIKDNEDTFIVTIEILHDK